VEVGPGEKVLGHKLNTYMPFYDASEKATKLDLNSLFAAVEYGTGVAANVGGPQWVNREGPTKRWRERFDAAIRPEVGAWALGRIERTQVAPGRWRSRRKGVLFRGQKGFHFLYDERTRKPRALYEERFKKEFPSYLQKALRTKLNTKAVSIRDA